MGCEIITTVNLTYLLLTQLLLLCVMRAPEIYSEQISRILYSFCSFQRPTKEISEMVRSKEIKLSFTTSCAKRVIIQANLSLVSKSHPVWNTCIFIYSQLQKMLPLRWNKRHFLVCPHILIRFVSPITDKTQGKSNQEWMAVASETGRVSDSINFNSVSEGKGVFLFKKRKHQKERLKPIDIRKGY